MAYLHLKTVISEILLAAAGVGGIMNGWSVYDSHEGFEGQPTGKFVVLVDGLESNGENAGNRWSLIRQLINVHVCYINPNIEDEALDVNGIRAEVNGQAWNIRRLIKNNPLLTCTSAPAGFAQKSKTSEIERGKLILPNGAATTAAWIRLEAWHMKNEVT